MACDLTTLESTAKCFDCLDEKGLKLAEIALLVDQVLALTPGADVTPKGLLARAKCFQCLPQKDRELAQIGLLCIIST